MPQRRSAAMEQQVERIKRLLVSNDAQVVWNEKIPDPDNPKQSRQIDVTIRKDGMLTLVECRLHTDVQNVTWIEELMGRRMSLRADAVIAVSASGFTEGAILKANAHGVILRDLATLSPDEVQHWGKVTEASLTYYEFKETVITFTLPPNARGVPLALTKADGSPAQLRGLFDQIMRSMDGHRELSDGWAQLSVNFSGVCIGGVPPVSSSVETNVRRIARTASLVSVVAYSAVQSPTADAYARVQHFDEAFEILDAEQAVAVVLDLSMVPTPKNCFFHMANFDFGRVVTLKWLKPIGLSEAMDFEGMIEMRVKFS